MTEPRLYPRLVVRDAARAIDFYRKALGAEELERFSESSGAIVHAEMRVGDDVFSVTEEDATHNVSPEALGGSGSLLTLVVDDPDAVAEAMVDGGARVLIPVEDRYYGRREGRLRDPFGHLWILSRQVEDLSPDEIRRRAARAD